MVGEEVSETITKLNRCTMSVIKSFCERSGILEGISASPANVPPGTIVTKVPLAKRSMLYPDSTIACALKVIVSPAIACSAKGKVKVFTIATPPSLPS